jgi:hypothetical protein
MYHENCPRSVLVQLMDKFRMVLVKHEHEDPAVHVHVLQWDAVVNRGV